MDNAYFRDNINFIKRAKFRCLRTLLYDALRLVVYSGSDPRATFDIESHTYKANLIEATLFGFEAGIPKGVRLLIEAGYERYWKEGKYDKQEAFSDFLEANKDDPKTGHQELTVAGQELSRKLVMRLKNE
jgi:hypothetical protein